MTIEKIPYLCEHQQALLDQISDEFPTAKLTLKFSFTGVYVTIKDNGLLMTDRMLPCEFAHTRGRDDPIPRGLFGLETMEVERSTK